MEREDNVHVEIVTQKVKIKAASFVMELDGFKVIKLEIDGHPITHLGSVSFRVAWDIGELPSIVSSVPRVFIDKLLMECKGDKT